MDYFEGQEYIIAKKEQRRFHEATMFYIKTIERQMVVVRTNNKTDCAVPRFYFDRLLESKRLIEKNKMVIRR